jgi:hypothetical protein
MSPFAGAKRHSAKFMLENAMSPFACAQACVLVHLKIITIMNHPTSINFAECASISCTYFCTGELEQNSLLYEMAQADIEDMASWLLEPGYQQYCQYVEQELALRFYPNH